MVLRLVAILMMAIVSLSADEVTCTVYHATVGECDASPRVTASGFYLTDEAIESMRYIAVSRDFLREHELEWYDTVILVGDWPFCGPKIVVDTMAPRWHRRIDLLVPMEINTKDKGVLVWLSHQKQKRYWMALSKMLPV